MCRHCTLNLLLQQSQVIVMKWQFGETQGAIYGHAATCAVGVSPLPTYYREGKREGKESF